MLDGFYDMVIVVIDSIFMIMGIRESWVYDGIWYMKHTMMADIFFWRNRMTRGSRSPDVEI